MQSYKCRIEVPLKILISSLLLSSFTSINAQGIDDNGFPQDPIGNNVPFANNNGDGEGFNNEDGIPSLAPTTIDGILDGDGIPSLSPTIFGDGWAGDGFGDGDQSMAPNFDGFDGFELDGDVDEDIGDNTTDAGAGAGGDTEDASEAPSMPFSPSVAPTIQDGDGGENVPTLSPQPSTSFNVGPTVSMSPSFSMQPTTPQPPHHTVAPHHSYGPHAGSGNDGGGGGGNSPTTGGNHTDTGGNHTSGSHSGTSGSHQGQGNHQGGSGGSHQGGGSNHQGSGSGSGGGSGSGSGGGNNNQQGGSGHSKQGPNHNHHHDSGQGQNAVEPMTLPIIIFGGIILLSVAFFGAQRFKSRRQFDQVQNDDMNWDLELSTYRPGLT